MCFSATASFMAGVYVAATCISCLFSSHGFVRLFGGLAFAAFIAAYLVYATALVSTWCFFAAILSVLIYVHLRVWTLGGFPAHALAGPQPAGAVASSPGRALGRKTASMVLLAGALSVGTMSVTNIRIDSDFKWLLLIPSFVWLAATVLLLTSDSEPPPCLDDKGTIPSTSGHV